MKEWKVYDVYIDDGSYVYKVTIPAKTKALAELYVSGNGEIIATRESPNFNGIDADHLAGVMLSDNFTQTEVDVVTRLLALTGLVKNDI